MSNDSFDPRSWGGASGGSESVPFVNKQKSVEKGVPDGEGAIPEAWRGIAGAGPQRTDEAGVGPQAAGKADGDPPRADNSPDAAASVWRRHGLVMGSALLLLAGAGGAWLTRTGPVASQAAVPLPEKAAALPGLVERRVVLAGPGDIFVALTAAGVDPVQARAAADAAAKAIAAPGEIHALFQIMPQGKAFILQHLQVSSADGSGVVVDRSETGQFTATPVVAELTRQIRILRGELDTDSFYSSAVAAGLVDTLIPEFINAFSYDFNLASEISPGDTFEVAYAQSVDGSGNAVGQPELLFASLTTKAKSLALYRFQNGGEVGWYDGNGASTKRGLMRTPVDGARISSTFGMRFHPVLQYNKMHKGTDFAAPVGTPIYAAKDGTVEWAAMKGPNGNLTILQHDKGMQTYYLHQNMFMPGVVAGAHVTQGQKIGEIGTTGRSTGPHLHYEVHMEGEPVDPLSIASDDAARKRLEGAVLQAFMNQRNRVDVARAKQAG